MMVSGVGIRVRGSRYSVLLLQPMYYLLHFTWTLDVDYGICMSTLVDIGAGVGMCLYTLTGNGLHCFVRM